MRRRNVLIGLGSATAGLSAVFGSGAFTQVEADRSLTIGVSEDDSALLALDAGDNVASVYNDDTSGDTSGELVIDTNKLGGDGFNVGATAQIGETSESLPDPAGSPTVPNDNVDNVAFVVTNNFDTVADGDNGKIDITLDLTDADSETDGDGELFFIGTEYDSDGNKQTTLVASSDDNADGNSITFDSVVSSGRIYFTIQIQTDSVTGPNDFEGNITFTAEPSSS